MCVLSVRKKRPLPGKGQAVARKECNMSIDYALTVRRPWIDAMIDPFGGKPKNIENRTWLPMPSLIGQRFALHGSKATLQKDRHSVNMTLNKVYGHWRYQYDPTVFLTRPCGAILATAVLAGWVADKEKCPAAQAWRGNDRMKTEHFGRFVVVGDVRKEEWVNNRWAINGQVWWILRDVVTVKPIPAKGQQLLWELDAATKEALNA
jgi:hypothetical protein